MLLGRTQWLWDTNLRLYWCSLVGMQNKIVKELQEGSYPRGSLTVQVSGTRRDLHEIEDAGRKEGIWGFGKTTRAAHG